MSLANEILYGRLDKVEQLIQSGADVEEVDEYGFTPLIEAAIANNFEITKLLLEYGADINKSDVTGRSALHWTSDNNNLELCKLLLANKADPNAYTYGAQPVLVYPLLRNQNELKKLMYQHGADLNFAQDFINTKLLGHRYELAGYVDIVNSQGQFIELDYEGFILEFTLEMVRNSIERYQNNFSARHLRSYFNYLKKIIKSFVIASELLKYQKYTIDIRHYENNINAMLNNQLLLLPIAYEGHAITFIKYANLLVRCDRGAYSKVDGTVAIYQLGKPERFSIDFIKKLLFDKQSKEFVNDGIKQYLGLTLVEQLPVEAQLIGNCSWANVEAVIPAMLFLLQLQPSNTQRDLQGYKAAALSFYHDWLIWDKEIALNECIKSFMHVSTSKARKASKAAILGAVLFQKCNYHSPRDLEKAEKILKILAIPEYQYILQSYVKVYWKDRQTRAGRNLAQLMDDCGIKL
jgi:hypothetical protein